MTKRELLTNLKGLKELEAAGRAKAAWVLSSREILMSQIQPRATAEAVSARADYSYFVRAFNQWFNVRVLRPAMAVATIIALMLGYTAANTIANASLPGDMLYPIKTATENVQLALTFADEEKVKLQMDFVSRRADEIQQLVQKDGDSTATAQKVNVAAKRIAADVQAVNEKLNKIATAAPSNNVISAAKAVDTKTLQVTQSLVQATSALPQEVKKDVAKDINAAIVQTEAAGTSALGVIVDNFEKGGVAVSDAEVTNRVSDRIKNTEENIQTVANEVNSLLGSATVVSTTVSTNSSTAATLTSTTVAATSTLTITVEQPLLNATSTATSTIQNIIEKPKTAQATLEQAKDLLSQKNFSSALEKVAESKQTVANVATAVQTLTNTLPPAAGTVKIEIKNEGAANGTSTVIIFNNATGTATTTK